MGNGLPERHQYDLPYDETEVVSLGSQSSSKDPFSDLSLFVAQRVKEEMDKLPQGVRLSTKLSASLMQDLASDIKSRFPNSSFANSILKSSWEKVQHYLRLIADQKKLWSGDGTLSIPAMISENLKNRFSLIHLSENQQQISQAEQVALSVSECVATLDHIRPDISYLTRWTWNVQSHLYPKAEWPAKSPFEIDAKERFLTRIISEENAIGIPLNQQQLLLYTRDLCEGYKMLSNFSLSQLRIYICTLYADKLYENCLLRKTLGKGLAKLSQFMENQVKQRPDVDRLIPALTALFSLCATHHHTLIRAQLESSLKAPDSLSHHILSPYHPLLNRELYAYIQSELLALKTARVSKPLDTLLKRLVSLIDQISELPKLEKDQSEILELLAWRAFAKFHLPDQLPALMEKVLAREVSSAVISQPDAPFENVVRDTLRSIRRIKELQIDVPTAVNPFVAKIKLTPSEDLYRKAFMLAMQGDLLFRCIYPHQEDRYLKLVQRKWKQLKLCPKTTDHDTFIQYLVDSQIKEHPVLRPFAAALRKRITVSYKSFWYHDLCAADESSLSRFIHWHAAYRNNTPENPLRAAEIETLCTSIIPAIPVIHK